MSSLWSKVLRGPQRRFRRARARLIVEKCPEIVGSTICDVGGALPFWNEVQDIIRPKRVYIFNVSQHRMVMGKTDLDEVITIALYDGKRLPIEDAEVDFVICNSVIEHVSPIDRRNLANEVMRVGRRYVVQTPSRAFPLELHFGLPFVHWLPRGIARMIVPLSPFALLARVDSQAYFDETRLLSRDEFESYFPGGRLMTERFMGIPKSMLVFG